jgi:filamin
MIACLLSFTISDPSDIVDGNLKLLLGLLWRLIFKYHISANIKKPKVVASEAAAVTSLESVDSGDANGKVMQSEMTASKILLAWFQASLPQLQITNFSKDWNDGIKLSALVNYCRPGLIPNWEQKDPQNALENTQNAISIAHEHLDIPQVLHAEDLAVESPDKLVVMTYLGYFCCPGSPGEKVLLDWIEVVMPEVKIDNFTSDWKDGDALCSLVAAFAPSAISRDELDGKTNLEITRAAMQVAQEQFQIKPFFLGRRVRIARL